MANSFEYIISLKDKFSAVTDKVNASVSSIRENVSGISNSAGGAFNKLNNSARKSIEGTDRLKNSIQELKGRLDVAQRGIQTTHSRNAFRFYTEEAKKLERQIRRLEAGISGNGLFSKLKSWRNDFASSIPGANLLRNPIAGAAGAIGGLWHATGKAMEAGKERMKMQVLTGSSEIGGALYDGLTKFATDTVFGSEVYDMGAQMLANGIKDADVLPLMKQLGDISMGDAQKLGSLSLAFSQITSAGKLMGQDLLQMVNAGFNPLQVISEATGESMTSLKEKMSKGLITVDDVRNAMAIATGEGGKFNNMLEKVAETPYGQLEGLRGQIDQMVISIGEAFLPIATKLMSFISWLGEKAGPVLKPFAVILGTVSAVLLVLAAAQWVANLAVWAFPGVWIIMAIVALIAAITWLISKVSGWGEAWDHTVKGAKLAFKAFVEFHKAQFTALVQSFMMGIDRIRLAWTKFKQFIGLGDKDANQEMILKMEQSIKDRQEAIMQGYVKAGKLSMDAIEEFKKAGSSLKWNSGDGFSIKDAMGIPGTTAGLGLAGAGANGAGGKTEGKKTNESIATGGTRHNYVTINLKNLIEILNIEGKSFRESTSEMERQVLDALLRVTASATTAAQ